MTPLRWILVVVGLAVAALVVRKVCESPPARPPVAAGGAPAAPAAAEDPATRTSQVELLGGPPTTDVAPDAALGTMASRTDIEADRRKGRLAEVLEAVENSPVYVEGVDGPRRDEPPLRR